MKFQAWLVSDSALLLVFSLICTCVLLWALLKIYVHKRDMTQADKAIVYFLRNVRKRIGTGANMSNLQKDIQQLMRGSNHFVFNRIISVGVDRVQIVYYYDPMFGKPREKSITLYNRRIDPNLITECFEMGKPHVCS